MTPQVGEPTISGATDISETFVLNLGLSGSGDPFRPMPDVRSSSATANRPESPDSEIPQFEKRSYWDAAFKIRDLSAVLLHGVRNSA